MSASRKSATAAGSNRRLGQTTCTGALRRAKRGSTRSSSPVSGVTNDVCTVYLALSLVYQRGVTFAASKE